MITKLTKKQEQQLVEFREHCLKIGLSTERLDRSSHRVLVDWIYTTFLHINKSPIIWYVESPFMYNLVINVLGGNLGENLSDNLWENLWNNLKENLLNNLRGNIRDNLGENLRENLWGNLGENLRENLWGNLGGNLGENLRENLWENISNNLRENIEKNLWENLLNNLRKNIRDNLGENLRKNIRDNLWNNINDDLCRKLRENFIDNFKIFHNVFWTSADLYWIAFYMFPMLYVKHNIFSSIDATNLKNMFSLHSNIGCIFYHKNVCFISERPIEIHKKGNQLHNENGPSVLFADGYCLWHLNGVNVPKELVVTPSEKLDPHIVLEEKNAEVRREIIRKIGIHTVIEKLGATVIESGTDLSGRQYELLNFSILGRDRLFLKMKNPSVDTWHIEGVHPECNTIEKALAWRNHQWEVGTDFDKYEEPIILT